MPNIHTHTHTTCDCVVVSAKTRMHMQLGFTFFISEDCSYAAGFMNTSQKCNHWFGRHCITVFWSHNDFAFVLGTTEEKAEGAFDLFLVCEFFYNFVKSFRRGGV